MGSTKRAQCATPVPTVRVGIEVTMEPEDWTPETDDEVEEDFDFYLD